MNNRADILKKLVECGRLTLDEHKAMLTHVNKPDVFYIELIALYKNKVNQFLITTLLKIRFDNLEKKDPISKEEAEAIAIGYFYSYIAAHDPYAAIFHFMMTTQNIYLIPLGLSSIIPFLKKEGIRLNDDLAICHIFKVQRVLFEALTPIWLLINDIGIDNLLEMMSEVSSCLPKTLFNGLIAYQQLVVKNTIDFFINQLQWFVKYCQEEIVELHFKSYFEASDKIHPNTKIKDLFDLKLNGMTFELRSLKDRIALLNRLIDEQGQRMADEKSNSQLMQQPQLIHQQLNNKFGSLCAVPLNCCVYPGLMLSQSRELALQAEAVVQAQKSQLREREQKLTEDKTALDQEIALKNEEIANKRKELVAEHQNRSNQLRSATKNLMDDNQRRRTTIAGKVFVSVPIGNGPLSCKTLPIIYKP